MCIVTCLKILCQTDFVLGFANECVSTAGTCTTDNKFRLHMYIRSGENNIYFFNICISDWTIDRIVLTRH